MYKLVYEQKAIDDLDGIYDLIATDNAIAAQSYINSIREQCRRLRDYPELGPSRSDIRPGLRMLPMRKRAVALYRIEDDTVVIVRITYGGQDYDALFDDEV